MARRRNAVELLQEDHDRVRGLLRRLTESTERAVKSRQRVLDDVVREMDAHSTIEKEIVYPAFREAAENRDDEQALYEFLEEHHIVDDVELPDIIHVDAGTVEFAGRAAVLEELITHHMSEEEERMFPRMVELFDEKMLEHMGSRMMDRKRTILTQHKQQKKAA